MVSKENAAGVPSVRMLVLDAETYYEKGTYSLSSMTTQEYVEDARFQQILWAGGYTDSDKTFGLYNKFERLKQIDWANTCLIAHNAQFDGAILDEHLGIRPKRVFCTMAMAQTLGIQKLTGSVSLARLAEFFQIGEKGTYVLDANGKRREDFSRDELIAYMNYCRQDVSLTRQLFNLMAKYLPKEELLWHSCVNKMYTEPHLRLNTDVLYDDLARVITDRKRNQQELLNKLEYTSLDTLVKHLGSNDKFAVLLEMYGAEPPLKPSPSNPEKLIFAFAKTDQGMKALLEHENPMIQLLAETRLGVKSNVEQTRLMRLISIAELPSQSFRIPHKNSGAHTHRLSGTDGINIQNFPSGRVKGQTKALRKAIEAIEPGGKVSAPDSGQIEARILAVIANDTELIDTFARGDCPYSNMASTIYNQPADKIKRLNDMYGSTGDKQFKPWYMYRQTGKAAILQLGYAARANGFFRSLRDMYGVTTVSLSEAEEICDIYADERWKIAEMWDTCKLVMEELVSGGFGHFGGADGRMFYYTAKHSIFGNEVPGIRLPNGTWLTYPKMRKAYNPETGFEEFLYLKNYSWMQRKPKKGESRVEQYNRLSTRIWHGTIIENLCQALAFAALKWQAIRIQEHGPVLFNVHDEFIVPGELAETASKIMRSAPPWLPGIVFECDYKIADNYGEC